MQKNNFQNLQDNLVDFLKEYLKKSNSKGFIVGLSGGLDSAVVAKLCSLAGDTNLLLMPTKTSNKINLAHALEFCENLNLNYEIIHLDEILYQFLISTKLHQTPEKLRIGNIIARVRMILLYDYSAKLNSIVVGTSNKSERMIGYGTIYGDLACACNPIGEIYKSDLYEFAKFLKIDSKIINKPPSADLWENQSDEGDLGFSYFEIDSVLRVLEGGGDLSKFDQKLVSIVRGRVERNSFKLKMPEVAKVDLEGY